MATNEVNLNAPPEIARLGTRALIVGVIFTAIFVVGSLLSPDGLKQFFRSYLVGYIFWVGLGIGSLGLLMVQYLINGGWGLMIRRVLEAGTRTLPLLFVLFIPILLGMGKLYPWLHAAADDHVIQTKSGYLNTPFFIARWVILFAFWMGVAFFLNKWSKQNDETGDFGYLLKARKLSGPGVVFFAIAVTFASVDWVMSLDPHWFSTIFGLLFVIGFLLSTMCFTIIIMSILATREPMERYVWPRHFHDLGKLFLAFVMVWTYFQLSQFLITWAANLPEETRYYLRRSHGLFGFLGYAMIIVHFALPFLLLLNRNLKRNYRKLLAVAVFVFIMRSLDIFWMIAPETYRDHTAAPSAPAFHNLAWAWTDFVAILGIGGLWVWYFTYQLRQRPLIMLNDPKLIEEVEKGAGGGH